MASSLVGAEALGFEIEAAKPEFTRFRIVGHRFEFGARLVMPAFDQSRLCFEQVDQRFLIGADEATGTGRHLARQQGIAGAGGDQAGRQRLIAAVALAGAKIARDGMRRGPDRADQPPGDHDDGDQRDQAACRDDQLRLIELAFPDQRQIAGAVREPGEAIAENENEDGRRRRGGSSISPPCRRRRWRWRECSRQVPRRECELPEIVLNAAEACFAFAGRLFHSLAAPGEVAILHLIFHAGGDSLDAVAFDIADGTDA